MSGRLPESYNGRLTPPPTQNRNLMKAEDRASLFTLV